MPVQDQFGGVLIEDERDQFGGIPSTDELKADQFGGIPIEDDNGLGRLASAVQTAGLAANTWFGDTVSGISRLINSNPSGLVGMGVPPSSDAIKIVQQRFEETPEAQQARIAADPAYQFGQKISKTGEEYYKPNPKFKGEFFADVLPGAAVSTVGTLVGGALAGPAAAATLYAAQSGQQGAQEALDAGKPEDADVAFLGNALAGGLSEATLGIGKGIWKYVKAARAKGVAPAAFKRWVKEAAKRAGMAGLREGTQEGGEQAIQNLVASETYDPNRKIMAGVPQSFAAGSIIGAGIGGMAEAGVRTEVERPDIEADQRVAIEKAIEQANQAGLTETAKELATDSGLMEAVPATEVPSLVDQAIQEGRLSQAQQPGEAVIPNAQEVQRQETVAETTIPPVTAQPAGAVRTRYIQSTALKVGDHILTGPNPYSSHKEIMEANGGLLAIYQKTGKLPDLNEDGGFMVLGPNGLQFVGRDEAVSIARDAGQVPGTFSGKLHSQDLEPVGTYKPKTIVAPNAIQDPTALPVPPQGQPEAPVTAKQKKAAISKTKAEADEFRKLLAEHGEQLGFIKNAIDYFGEVPKDHPGDAVAWAPRIAAERKASMHRAISELGGDVSAKRDNAFLASLLPKLKTRVESFQKLVDVPVDQLGVGSEFSLHGEKFTVTNIDPDKGVVTLKDGITMRVDENSTIKVDPDSVKVSESTEFVPEEAMAEQAPPPKAQGGDLFGSEEMPFNLAGEKTTYVEPSKETTGYGTDTLTQNDLFAIADVTKSIDPFKSADAAQSMYGGPQIAIERITNQLRVMDSDPAVKRSFTKEQRIRLKEVLNVLQGRASKPETPSQTETPGQPETTQAAVARGPSSPMTPLPGVTSLTPKSQRKIIADLAKGLNVPIRFGRLTTNKFGGYFKKVANLIGSKLANDIPMVSHEVGHKLDATFGLSSDPAVSAEFDRLGDPATPGSMSSWTKSKSKAYKMGEGMAEFTRLWLTDPAKAQTEAPNAHRLFEENLNANKDFGDTMRQAQSDIRVWRTSEPQARLRSHISIGENPNKTRYTLSQLTRDLLDELHIARLTMDDARKGSSIPIPPSQDIYLLARNLRGSYGMADTFIRSGVTDFKTKSVSMGTSLEDALKPVAGRIDDFTDWIVSKRAQELHARGKKTGLLDSDVQAVAAKFDSDPAFQKAFDDLKKWNDALLQYAVDSGLVTPEGAQKIRDMNHDYVPFHRVFEIGAGEAPAESSSGTGRGLNVGKSGSLKTQKGSQRDIINPLETMVKNAYTIITASEKAAIHQSLADLSSRPNMGKWIERVAAPKEKLEFELEAIRKQLEDAGADTTSLPDDLLLSFWKQSQRTPYGENIIRIMRDGKPELYRLNKDLYSTFHALDMEDAGTMLKILSAPAQTLRSGVTLEPGFNLANALRDTVGAGVISRHGAIPFHVTLRGFAAMIGNKKLVSEWAASGGKSAIEASFFDRTKMQRFLAEKVAKQLTPAEKALIWTKSPLTALRAIGSVFEEATRIGEYQAAFEKLTKAGMPEGEARRLAAFESRDRQDFAMGGAKTKALRRMTPFWNAGLQANVRLFKAFKERPVETTLKGLAFITIPKLIEQAINWDDEDYWSRNQWERDAFFMFPIGKGKDGHTQFLRIPVPFELGVIFASLPGRVMQYAKQHDPSAAKGVLSMFGKQTIPNPIPTPVSVVYENFLSGPQGWSVFRDRPIVPGSLKEFPADMQFTEQTSRIAKKLGATFNFSPVKIDSIIESTTGGMGKVLTGRQVPGARFVTTPLVHSNQAVEEFYSVLDKMEEEVKRKKSGQPTAMDVSSIGYLRQKREAISKLRTLANKTTDEQQKLALYNRIFEQAKQGMNRVNRK